MPAGLRDAIDGRLRELPPQERAALAAAAVLGQNFTPRTWAGMTDERPTTNDQQQTTTNESEDRWSLVVGQLLQRQFLVEDSAGYRFGHETLREVIYDELDTATRRTLHLRAAETLEQEHFARVEALAQHLYLAGAWDKSLPYLIQAGDRARAVYAWQDALRCYDQAIEAAARAGAEAADALTRWDIQLKRGEVATSLGDYPTAIAAYEEVWLLTEQDADTPNAAARAGTRRGAQIQALNGLSYIYGMRNNYARARETIRQAMALAEASPRLLDRAEVGYQAGLISFRMDDYAEARKLLAEAMNLYQALGLEVEQAKCRSMIGWSYLRQDGPTDQVINHFTQALEVYRREGDRFSEHLCLSDIAGTHLSRGRLAETIEAISQCLPFFSSINALDEVSACIYTRGEAYRRLGRLDEALESLQESFSICTHLDRTAAAQFNQVFIAATLRDMGRYDQANEVLKGPLHSDDRMIKVRALLVASDIQRTIGRHECAWSYLAESFALTRWLGSKTHTGIAYRLLAQLRTADTRGELPPATSDMLDIETSFAESARLLLQAHCDDELALTRLAYGQYLLANHRPAEAREALSQARSLMQVCGMFKRLDIVQELLAATQAAPASLLPGQRRVLLARKGVPRGRSLRPDELVEVIWTVDMPDQHELGQSINKAAARQERLRRLCEEAAAQGAEPTVGDLASALGVTARTVDRDIAALRAAGNVLATRGSAG
jgi:tetratricopeptide (TPR) repeat protein